MTDGVITGTAMKLLNGLQNRIGCNGKIGMDGGSAGGIVQYLASGANPPYLTCAIPVMACWNQYEWIYPGGEYRKADLDYALSAYGFNDEMKQLVHDNPNYNEEWHGSNCNTRLDSMNTPMYHVGGWYDGFHPHAIDAFYKLQFNGGEGAVGNQKLVVGPWTHCRYTSNTAGQVTFPSNALWQETTQSKGWFDYWLKDSTENQMKNDPIVSLYLMGPTDTTGHWNNWLEFDDWPFSDTDTFRLYPGQNSLLSAQKPAYAFKSFEFDPDNPVPTTGGRNLFASTGLSAGIYDNAKIWGREDILSFEAPSFDEPYDIFGRIVFKSIFIF